MGALQIIVAVGIPLLGAFLPFGLTHDWTATKAALVIATLAWVATFSSSHCMNKRNLRSGWPTPARVQSAAIGPFVGARGSFVGARGT
jgi:hypothetical protein